MKNNMSRTEALKTFIRNQGLELVGIADLKVLKNMPSGLPTPNETFFQNYQNAIVMGAQLGILGKGVPGREVSKFMECVTADLLSYLEQFKCMALPIHTEDEFDPLNRIGLLSLKVLAKAAGLGWQGRSLLIISPKFGPIHRLSAVLTNLELTTDSPIANQCNECNICVDRCPTKALTLTSFLDHPNTREEVLNINRCLGDDGCMICIQNCPYAKTNYSSGK